MSDGDEPEGGGADGLAGGEALGGGGSAAGSGGRGGRGAVRVQSQILGAVADNQGQGKGGGEDDDGENQGDVLPADGIANSEGLVGKGDAEAAVDAEVNQGDNQQGAAAAHKVGPPHGGGHTAGEPVVDGGHHRHPAANALAEGHYHIGEVKHIEGSDGPEAGVNLPEKEETDAENDEAGKYHTASAKFVGEVAFDGAHQAALDAGESQGQGELAAGPHKMLFQGHGPEGHRVEQRHRGNGHHEAGGGDDVPAVVDVGPAQPGARPAGG